MTLEEYAKEMGLSLRRVQQLCLEGKIEGAYRSGRKWYIRKTVLPLPSGSTSFEVAKTNFYYVDKSFLISRLVQAGPGLYFFSRPRRFGKSLNMDMLRCFFSLGANRANFKGLQVEKDEKAMRDFGKYPVIAISFKDLKVANKVDFLSEYSLLLAKEVERHPELLDSQKVGISTKEILGRIIRFQATESDLKCGLERLSAALSSHYGVGAIALLDEYDTPLLYPTKPKDKKEIASFFKSLSSLLLKDNPSLAYGILTGITKVGGESIFSDLNNLECHDLFSPTYSDCFGFTQAEVDEILRYYGKEGEGESIREWYDGYRIAGKAIYNPWSICQWMRKGFVYDSYWAETSDSSSLLKAVPELTNIESETLQALLNGETVSKRVSMKYFIENPSMENAYGLLLSGGYLTSDKAEPVGNAQYDCDLSLPNHEIALVFSMLAKNMAKVEPSIAERIYRSVVSEDYDAFLSCVESYLYDSISYFNTGSEGFYQGFTLGLSSSLTGLYRIKSNRESGLGRFDICLFPQRKGMIPLLIEIKVTEGKDLEKGAEEALSQIEKLDYASSLKEEGHHFYIALGIAYSGKKAIMKKENKLI